MGRIADFRNAKLGFSDHLPYAAFVEDGIMLNKDGALMAAWQVNGPDVESQTNQERNVLAAQLNNFLSRLSSGYMLHIDAFRKSTKGYPEPGRSHFEDEITELIDEERRRSFQTSKAHFETTTVIVLTYLPPELANSKFVKALYSIEGDEVTEADTTLSDFQKTIKELSEQLSSFAKIQQLKSYTYMSEDGVERKRCRFLEYIQQSITGDYHPVNLPDIPMFLDSILGADFTPAITPTIDNSIIGVVAIDGFPHESFPGMLSSLDNLTIEYRWSTRFIFLDSMVAKKRIEGFMRRWRGAATKIINQMFNIQSKDVDADALEMVTDAQTAITEASMGDVAYGYYTSVVIVYANTMAQLDKDLNLIKTSIKNLGFNARIETINANEAYLGSLCGNGYQNVRRPLIHTFNLAHLIPINSIWVGSENNPCPFYPPESPPLMQVATAGSSPFRVNLHVKDVGHTLVFGPTGSGKSTLLSLLAAQFRRYAGAQVFFFDKGKSILPMTLAVNGNFYDFGDDENKLSFCPLATIETDADQAWAEDWIISLLKLQNVKIKAEHRNAIHDAMSSLRKSEAKKTISNFMTSLQDKELKAALKFYSIDGALGHILDSETDSFQAASFTAIEMEELMNMGEEALMPVLLYLFHRIEKNLTGAPTLIVLDEAWVMLGHDAFRAKIREWLKVLRRKNCAVILATQSLSDAANSGIMDVLVENCPTKIMLPNPKANQPASRRFYEEVGLNERQIEIITTARQAREYYMVSPEGRRLFDMQLGPIALSFAGVSGVEDLNAIRDVHLEHGENWPKVWLDMRGVNYDYG